jgi:hypothetical protein
MEPIDSRKVNSGSLMNEAAGPDAQSGPKPSGRLSPLSAMDASMGMQRFLNQQNIERYLKLLGVVSDEAQRRQVENLLEEEKGKAAELSGRMSGSASDRAP